MIDAGRTDLEPFQAGHVRKVRRRPRTDDDLDLRVGVGVDIEIGVAVGLDDIEVGRERSKALDRIGTVKSRGEQQAHRVNDSGPAARRRRGEPSSPDRAERRGRQEPARFGAAVPGASTPSSSTWLKPSRSANRPSGPGAHQFHLPEQPHRRRHEQDPDDRRVDERPRSPCPTPMLLIVIVSARANAANTVTMISGRAGDDAGRLRQALGHRRPCCRRSGGTPPGSATAAGPRSPSTARRAR